MKQIRTAIRLCLILLATLTVTGLAQESSTLLVGGEQAGPFRLGSSYQTVLQKLGQPEADNPSAGDPGTKTKLYPKHQLGFLVNPESKVIGITVARKDWKTARGLGVGSPVVAFQEVYGRGLKRGQGQIAYPQQGIALTHKGGIVQILYIVKKDAVDSIKGDHLVVGGTRAGQLRLGRSSDDLLKLLGPPSSKEGAQNNIWVYPDRGIRLGFIQGRLHLVGVTSGDWVTPSGLKVGRPFSEMKRELGSDYRVERSSVFYDKWGIGARLQGDMLVEILIFNPKKGTGQG